MRFCLRAPECVETPLISLFTTNYGLNSSTYKGIKAWNSFNDNARLAVIFIRIHVNHLKCDLNYLLTVSEGSILHNAFSLFFYLFMHWLYPCFYVFISNYTLCEFGILKCVIVLLYPVYRLC